MHIDHKIFTYLPAIIDKGVRDRCTSTENGAINAKDGHDRKRKTNITTDLNKNMPAIVETRIRMIAAIM